MTDLNAKALKAAVTAFSYTAAMNGTGNECLAEAIRAYLRESGIGAVVEAAREWADPEINNRRDTAEAACDKLHAATAALDKEPGE